MLITHPMEQNINRLLQAAKAAAKSGDNVSAEQSYKQALRVAEVLCGEDSAGVVSVLLEIEEFYQALGRSSEAKKARERMRRIMAQFIQDVPPK